MNLMSVGLSPAYLAAKGAPATIADLADHARDLGGPDVEPDDDVR